MEFYFPTRQDWISSLKCECCCGVNDLLGRDSKKERVYLDCCVEFRECWSLKNHLDFITLIDTISERTEGGPTNRETFLRAEVLEFQEAPLLFARSMSSLPKRNPHHVAFVVEVLCGRH